MSENIEKRVSDEDNREKELASIDRLFEEIRQYCTGAEFMKKLTFYSNFPYIGAYNAALVEEQRPGARFVLTARKWKKEHKRKIKMNARPVMILLPFYPVEFLFDIADTEPIDKNLNIDDNAVIEDIIRRNTTFCANYSDISYYMKYLQINLPKFGISYNHDYIVGSERRAEITQNTSDEIYVRVYKNAIVKYHNYYTISVDMKAKGTDELALLFHELAHFFCRHISSTWWKGRDLTKEIKEFEAETVSYLVCNRLGIKSEPQKYLAYYVINDNEIPPISLDAVFHAVDMIELLARESYNVTKSIMYKNDDNFKIIADTIIKREKDKEAEKKSV